MFCAFVMHSLWPVIFYPNLNNQQEQKNYIIYTLYVYGDKKNSIDIILILNLLFF